MAPAAATAAVDDVSPEAGPYTTGQGEWRYSLVMDRMQLPEGVAMMHGHGLATDLVRPPIVRQSLLPPGRATAE